MNELQERPIASAEYIRRYKKAKERALKIMSNVEELRMWEQSTTNPGIFDFSEERLNRYEAAINALESL